MKRSAVLVLTLLLGVGCASPEISDRAVEALQARVQSIREAVESEDRELTETRLDLLEQQVLRFRRNGELSDARSMRIMAAARGVASNLSELPEPYTPPVIVTVTPTPSPTEEKPEEKEEKAEEGGDDDSESSGDTKPGKGNGKDKGEDED